MSSQTKESNNVILSLLGTIFLFLVVGALIVMLGVVGVAFYRGMKVAEVEAKDDAPVAAAPAAKTTETEPASSDDGSANVADAGAAPAEAASGGGEGPDAALMEVGKASYATCAACHGPNGQGIKAGPMSMAPSLVGSELLLGDADTALLIVLKGIQKEGADYVGAMVGIPLPDDKLAAVLTYTRNAWGNSAPAVTAEQAAAARAKFAEVPASIKRAEIQAIVDAHQ